MMSNKTGSPFSFFHPLVCLVLFFAVTANADTPAAGYAGDESCQDCHEERMEDYKSTIHGNAKHPRSPASQHGCETCHGPRADHVKEMERKGAVPEGWVHTEVSEQVCLDCHNKGKVVLWPGSAHERRDLSCNDCHNVHGENKILLRAAGEQELCAECHKDIRSQLLRYSHHPIREGKVSCSDCHNPHGTVADQLIDANGINEKCYECHAEKRGPFLWEHAPVTENCMQCHTPHGSTHESLLISRTPFLCQQCHSNARHPGTLYALPRGAPATATVYNSLNNRAFNRDCMNCHNQVHGTNHPSGKSLSR